MPVTEPEGIPYHTTYYPYSVWDDIVTIIPWLIIIAYIVVTVRALVKLGKRPISEVERIVWVFIILLFPLIGAIAFFIINPGKQKRVI